jgi:hypothetical protein
VGGAKLICELREGIAKTGKGELSVTVRAKESKVGTTMGFGVEFGSVE